MPLAPNVQELSQYVPLYRNEQVWLPAIQGICQCHELDARQLVFAPPGTHIVFYQGNDLIIKLYCPLWPDDEKKEFLVLQALAGKMRYQIPEIVARGKLEGWSYLIIRRVTGIPLDIAWQTFDDRSRQQIAIELGRFMAELHASPTKGLEDLDVRWPAFIDGQIIGCIDQHQKSGIPEKWLVEIGAFLENLPTLYDTNFHPKLIHADLNPEHIFVQNERGRWHISGVIDFADAMLGHPYYEFVAPGMILRRSPHLLRIMLTAYGFAPGDLTSLLSMQLMAYTLLHRFGNIQDCLDIFKENPPKNLAELQAALWQP